MVNIDGLSTYIISPLQDLITSTSSLFCVSNSCRSLSHSSFSSKLGKLVRTRVVKSVILLSEINVRKILRQTRPRRYVSQPNRPSKCGIGYWDVAFGGVVLRPPQPYIPYDSQYKYDCIWYDPENRARESDGACRRYSHNWGIITMIPHLQSAVRLRRLTWALGM